MPTQLLETNRPIDCASGYSGHGCARQPSLGEGQRRPGGPGYGTEQCGGKARAAGFDTYRGCVTPSSAAQRSEVEVLQLRLTTAPRASMPQATLWPKSSARVLPYRANCGKRGAEMVSSVDESSIVGHGRVTGIWGSVNDKPMLMMVDIGATPCLVSKSCGND